MTEDKRIEDQIEKRIENSGVNEPIRQKRVLVCPNAFKGCLTALQAAEAIARGVERASVTLAGGQFGTPMGLQTRDWQPVCLPLADGGDGTLETLVAATGGTLHTVTVQDPLGRPVRAQWGRLGGDRRDTAAIEMAQASGIRLLRREEYAPEYTSTYGTGELMLAAIEAGCTRLLLGIGGSATNDGGGGMARALGLRLLDAQGKELEPGGAALARLAKIDRREWLIPPTVTVVVACDVDNPLCGSEGASAVYGPQKGASPKTVVRLDAALQHYCEVIQEQLGIGVRDIPGAGAAGGLGAGLLAFCHASLQPGTEMVMDAVGFDRVATSCALILTGEGRLDGQTSRGKVVAGVAGRARQLGIPVIALVGSIEAGAEQTLRPTGLAAAFSLVEGPVTVEEAMDNSTSLLANLAERVMILLSLGLRSE